MAPMTDSQPLPPPLASAPPPPRAPRRLRRTSSKAQGRKWLGVAGGLADYLGVSRTALRWGFVIGSFAGGLGLVAYLVAAILIPTDTQTDPLGDRISAGRPDRLLGIVAGTTLVTFAALSSNSFDLVAAALLVCAGVYLWSTSRDRPASLWRPDDTSTTAPWAPPRRGEPQSAASYASVAPSSFGADTASAPAHVAVEPTVRRSWGWAVFAGSIAAMVLLAPFVSGALVLTIGVGLLLLGMAAGFACGRRRMWVLMLPILVLGSLILPVRWFGVAGVPLNGGVGEVVVGANDLGLGAADPAHPVSERLAVGHLRVDLRNVVSSEQLQFALGTGQLDLDVPSDVAVTLHARVGMGQIQIDGQGSEPTSGPKVSVDVNGGPKVSVDVNGGPIQGGADLEVTRSLGPSGATRHLDIDARVGFGAIRVIRTAAEGGGAK